MTAKRPYFEDPYTVTNLKRSKFELERFLLFAIVVANKRADVQAKKLEAFLADLDSVLGAEERALTEIEEPVSPFELLRRAERTDWLESLLKKSKLGQYTKIEKAFSRVAHARLCLETCGVHELEAIHGIGPKTARFFLLHTRARARVAALDTHILRYLRDELGLRAPTATPTKATYATLEAAWLAHCDELGKDPAEYDLEVWTKYSDRIRPSRRERAKDD